VLVRTFRKQKTIVAFEERELAARVQRSRNGGFASTCALVKQCHFGSVNIQAGSHLRSSDLCWQSCVQSDAGIPWRDRFVPPIFPRLSHCDPTVSAPRTAGLEANISLILLIRSFRGAFVSGPLSQSNVRGTDRGGKPSNLQMDSAISVNAASKSESWASGSSPADWIPLQTVFDEIMRRRESKKVFFFVCALAAFAFIQAIYAIRSDSLGLLSDATHMFFHVAALSISLLGIVYSRRPSTFAFSYGYSRAEVLAAFSNSLFLVFLVLYVMASGLQRLFQPQAFSTDSVLSLEFGIVGLAINVAGMAMLGPGSSTFDHLNRFSLSPTASASSGSSSGSGNSFSAFHATPKGSVVHPFLNTAVSPMTASAAEAVAAASASGSSGAFSSNHQAIYLNFLSDGISSLAVIISSLLVRYRGWALADTLQCFATGAFTLWLVIPLFTATGKILLQMVPSGLAMHLEKARRQLTIIDGVLEVADEHYWLQTPGHAIGSVVLRVRSDVDEQDILAKAQKVFSSAPFSSMLHDLTIQVEKEPSFTGASSVPATHHHGHEEDSHHGHSHGGADHGHSHASHGHSHGGVACTGH
jgi:cation diffusion facilitator family transporter